MTDAELKMQMRENLKDDYLLNGSSDLTDNELLERALEIAIARVDSKMVANNLIKEFNSLKCISAVPPERLMKVDGVNECAAIYISLMQDVLARIEIAKNSESDILATTHDIVKYARNMLSAQTVERVAMVTLDENRRIIKAGFISNGTANFANVMPAEVSRRLVVEKPCYAFVAHNHLVDSCIASFSDINFTINFSNWLKQFGIELVDHIIVSKTHTVSMANDREYEFIFD